MNRQELLDIYSDYLVSAFGQTTGTELAAMLEGSISHDQVQPQSRPPSGRQAAGSLCDRGYAATGIPRHPGRCRLPAPASQAGLHKRRWQRRCPVSGVQRYHPHLRPHDHALSYIDQNELSEVGLLNNVLAGLNMERTLLEKLPTWPWRTDTLTGFLSATVLPILLFLIQNLLRKWLGG